MTEILTSIQSNHAIQDIWRSQIMTFQTQCSDASGDANFRQGISFICFERTHSKKLSGLPERRVLELKDLGLQSNNLRCLRIWISHE